MVFIELLVSGSFSGIVPLHASTHKAAGSDVILIDELGAPTDNTNNDVTTTHHGLAPKASGNANQFLAGDASWKTPTGTGGEANTASNAGLTGVGVVLVKSGTDLPFKSIAANSNKIAVSNDATNKAVNIDVTEANLTLSNIGGAITSFQAATGTVFTTSTQTIANKTIPIDTNFIKHSTTNAGGDIIVSDGTVYNRFPKGSDTQILSSTTTSLQWINQPAVGEVNTYSNSGTVGVPIILTKTGVDFPFKAINAGSTKVSVADNTTNKTVDIDITESNLNIANQTGSIGDARITDLAYTKLTSVPTTIVKTDQTNTFGAFAQVFPSSQLKINNPANTFAYILVGSAITANRNLTIPLLTGNSTFVFTTFNNSWTAVQNFPNLSTVGTNVVISSTGLTAARTFTFPDSTTTLVGTSDSRLSDSRTPTAHATTHSSGGSDPVTLSNLAGSVTTSQLPTGIPYANIGTNLILSETGLTAVRTVTFPDSTGLVVYDTDSRLSNARTPTAHKTTHQSGGSDAIPLDTLAATTDITTLNSTTSTHGLLPKLSGTATEFLNGSGAFSVPAGTGTGEANTYSNAGTTGVGITLTKTGVDLPFKAIDAGSTKVTVTNDTTNKTVDIDVVETNLNIANMTGSIGDSRITDLAYSKLTGVPSSAGEANTASNVGTGAGWFKAKSVVDLQFKSIIMGSTKLALTNNTNDLTIDVTEANLNIANQTGSIGDSRITDLAYSKLTSVPTTIVKTDQTNTFGAFAQIFPSSQLKINNPANTFAYILVGSAITANRNVTLPLLAGNDTFAFIGFDNAWSAVQNFPNLTTVGTNAVFSATGLTAARTFTFPDSTTTLVGTSDSRLSDARTPTAHKSTHVTGGSDAFAKSDILVAVSRYLELITDPASDTGRIWVNGADLKYWDNTAVTPVKQTVERLTNKGVASGYCDLDSSTLVPLSRISGLTNTQIAAGAAIAYSKLNLSTSIVNADIATAAAIAYSKLALTGTIVNADIAASAAIAYTKLALSGSIVNADVASAAAIAYSKLALAGSIVNADIATAAAIAYSKLNLGTSIVNGDIATAAAIAYTKLNLATSIVNGDISASAGIVYSKLSLATSIVNGDISTTAAIAYSKLGTNLKFSETGLTAVRTFTFPDATTTLVGTTDSRLSDARTPTAHKTTHQSGGTDSIALDTLAVPTDITTLNADTTAHGLLKKLDNIATHYIDGTGNWSVPAGNITTANFSYSYLIYRSGSTYYAQTGSGLTSALTSNADFATLLSGLISGISPAGTPTVFEFAAGDYLVNNVISIPATAIGNMTFRGAGMGKTRFLFASGLNGLAAGTTIITVGSNLTIAAGNTGTLTANCTAQSRTATMTTADGAKFAQNDFVLLKSDSLFVSPATTTSISKKGEIKQVFITPATGVVTFDQPVFDTYNTANAAKLYKLSILKNILIEDITFQKDASLTSTTINFVDFYYITNLRIVKCELVDNVQQFSSGFSLYSCTSVAITNCNLLQNPSNALNDQYGISFNACCQNVVVTDCTAQGRFRHSFEIANGVGGSLVDQLAGVCRNGIIANCVAKGAEVAAFDTHADGEFIIFENCRVLGTYSTYGVMVRAKDTKVINCSVHSSSTRGYYVLEAASYCELVNNTAYNCGLYGLHIADGVKHVKARGGYYRNNADTGILVDANADYLEVFGVTSQGNAGTGILVADSENIKLVQNTILGNTTAGISITSPTRTLTNVVVWGNDLSGQSTAPIATSDAIIVDGTTATVTLKNMNISGTTNTLTNVPDSALSTNVDLLATAQTITAAKTFNDTKLLLRNPANTFSTTVGGGAQTAAQTFTFPVTASDTIDTIAATATLTNKNINATNNTITDTSTALGDILMSNGTKFVRLARGSTNQVLQSTATTLQWATFNAENTGIATASGNGSTTVFNIAHSIGSTPTVYMISLMSLSPVTYPFTYTADATNIVVTFTTAPISGSNNVKISWRAVA